MEGEVLLCKVSNLGDWEEGMRWCESVKMTDHIPTEREYDGGSVGRINSLMLNVQELQEPLLYATALSPVLMSLMYGGKRRCQCKKHLCIWNE